MKKSDFEKYKNCEEYCFLDEDVIAISNRANDLCYKLNSISQNNHEERYTVIKELFGKIGSDPLIKANFNCIFGENIVIGDNFLGNCNLTIFDCAPVTIGDNCMIGPDVGIYTTFHPMTAHGRRHERREFILKGAPITIGNDVWIGGRAVVLPGVTIGDNVVIGAGSVVTRDIESNSVAVGNPAKVIRKLEE